MTTYADAHDLYRAAGWAGPLPLPPGQKWPPPAGWTGWTAPYPSYADSTAWADGEYAGTTQLALRMGTVVVDGVEWDTIGIDVDHYGDKRGADTLAAAEAKWGPLPGAPRSSSRGPDNPSGIRFYRVPSGATLTTRISIPTGRVDSEGKPVVLGDIEIIQRSHRYAVVWPSVHPDTGQQYQWWGRSGPLDRIPDAALLPVLPGGWIEALYREAVPGKDPATREQVDRFAREHVSNPSNSSAIKGMLGVFERLSTSGARHDALVEAACMAAREARAGHYPAQLAANRLREAWYRLMTTPKPGARQLAPQAAHAEFDSVWAWAVGQAIALDHAEARSRTGAHTVGVQPPTGHKLSGTSTPPPTDGTAAVTPAGEDADIDDGDDADDTDDAARGHKLRAGGAPRLTVVDGGRASASEGNEPGASEHAHAAGFAEGSPWAPIDLGPYLDGTVVRPEPSIGIVRRDGVRLFYPGKEHALIGEMEAGKSWVALASVVAEISAGHAVVYIHFEEDDPTDTVQRMLLLGADPDDVRARFHFIAPTCAITPDVVEHITALGPSLVILDGQNEAMAMHGMGIREEDGAAAYRRELVKPFTAAGAAVVSCDHVVKGEAKGEGYALGSVHKGNGINGSIVLLENAEPFGLGRRGVTNIFVTKDRPGMVRKHGQPTSIARKFFMGTLVVDATDEERLALAFWPPSDDSEAPGLATEVEWWDALRQPPLPADIVGYTGNGRKAIKDLARFMRAQATGNTIGFNHARASRALMDRQKGRKPKYSEDTVARAWEALLDMGRLEATMANTNNNPLGYHRWIAKDDDPS